MKVAALTHVRHDAFFLKTWIAYYSSFVGAENCFVIFDGNDWEPEVDVSSVNVLIEPGHYYSRLKNDARMVQAQNRISSELLNEYDLVIRGDCDEFVAFDPDHDRKEVLRTCVENGVTITIGLDVIQRIPHEPMLDRSKPIMKQRKFALVYSSYFKPQIISKPTDLIAGNHRVRHPQRTVVDPRVVMLHLGNADQSLSRERRLGRSTTFQAHMDKRDSLYEAIVGKRVSWDYEGIVAETQGEHSAYRIRQLLTQRRGVVTVNRRKAHLIKIPERFANTL